MSRNALRLYETAEFARIDVKISLTHSRYVCFVTQSFMRLPCFFVPPLLRSP